MWSGVTGSSKSPPSNSHSTSPAKVNPQRLIRKAPPSCRTTSPPFSTDDARVGEVSRKLKKALLQLQEEADLDILMGVLRDSSKSKRIRDDTVKGGGVEPKMVWTKMISSNNGRTKWRLQSQARLWQRRKRPSNVRINGT